MPDFTGMIYVRKHLLTFPNVNKAYIRYTVSVGACWPPMGDEAMRGNLFSSLKLSDTQKRMHFTISC